MRALRGVLPIAGLLLLWEIASRMGLYPRELAPGPTQVLAALLDMARSGELWNDLLASTRRALTGFLAGTSAGAVVGFLTGRTAAGRSLLEPVVQALRPLPSIGLLPLAILFFGLGETSKFLLVSWGVFFPVWVNSHSGFVNVDQHYVQAALSMGADRRRLLLEVLVPSALPLILSGMRVGIGLAFLNLVAAEMSGASVGIGYRVSVSHLVFRTDKMIGALAMLGVMGALADRVFATGTRRLFPWLDNDATSR